MNKSNYKRKLNKVKNRLASVESSGLTKAEYFDLRACLEGHASDEQLRILKLSINKWLENRISKYASIALRG